MFYWPSFKDRIAALVHEDARTNPLESLRHEAFIGFRLLTSFAALALVPLYLAFHGVSAISESLVLAFLLTPMLALTLVAKTGRLMLGHIICAAGLIGLAGTLALTSDALSVAALAWLILVPLEVLSALSVPLVIGSSLVAALAALGFALLRSTLHAGLGLQNTFAADLIVAVPAVLYGMGLALSSLRLDHSRARSERVGAARFRALSEAVGDLVIRHDRSGAVIEASHRSEVLFGLSPFELVGRGLFERIHVGDRPSFLKAIADASASGHTVSATLRLRLGSGGGRDGNEPRFAWIELRASPLSADPESIGDDSTAIVSIIRDVSDLKEREKEFESARSEAARIGVWKDRFLANISHELRTPLNAIIGFSEILGNDQLVPADANKRKEYATIIQASGQHLLAVVNSILDMSKIEAGSFDLQIEPFEVPSLIDSCCDMVSLKADQGGVEIIRAYPRILDELVADKRVCKQILINLLSNAVKFTPPQGRVTVSARPEGNSLAIVIADTGIGVVAKDLPRLGDPFFQAHDSYNRPYEGTGLGLSIVRGLVGLHGGNISLESAVGQGTRVTVRLPLDCRQATTGTGAPARIDTKVWPRPLGREMWQPETVKKIA